jgi:TolA-binding protein
MDRKSAAIPLLITGLLIFLVIQPAKASPLPLKSTAGALFPEGETLLYSRVLQAYRQGQLADCAHSQEMLFKYFPKSSLGDNALYLRGLLELQKDFLPEALKSFDAVEARYPLGNKRASGMLAKGVVLKKLNLDQSSRHVLERLIQNYPGSVEARRAQVELQLMDRP